MSRREVQIELSRAHHAHYAHVVFLSVFVSVANKGRLYQIPKLKMASSILDARSTFPSVKSKKVCSLHQDATGPSTSSAVDLIVPD